MTKTLQADLASGALAEAIADIAEDAARLILPHWRMDTAVETKADASPVTEADRAAEALILTRLAALYPGIQTVAEEAVAVDGAPERAEAWFWLIDPLDGTRGFVEGRESFTVNIALIHKGAPVAGLPVWWWPRPWRRPGSRPRARRRASCADASASRGRRCGSVTGRPRRRRC